MIKKNDILELYVDAMSDEGFGICRYTDAELRDFVVYVPFVAVGERIEAVIVKKLSSYAFGKLEKVISPSPARIEPDCRAFGKCGGCAYRHVSYAEELCYKKDSVVSAYRRAFGKDFFVDVADTAASPENEFYRNKVQFPIDEKGKCAFYANRSHRCVDISDCKLQKKAFDPVVRAFERYVSENRISVYNEETGKGLLRHLYLRYGEKHGEVFCCVVANGKKLPNEKELVRLLSEIPEVCGAVLCVNTKNTNVILGDEFRTLFGRPALRDSICGVDVEISAKSFYQVNKKQAEAIYEKACTLAAEADAEKVLDLYCGIGGITFAASKSASEAVGVEIVPEAVEDAKRAAERCGIKNVRFYASDANRLKSVLRSADFCPDTVIVDPPRKGLDGATVDALIELLPERIVYISCNPDTQARNCRDIMEKAKAVGAEYSLGTVYPYDMFPRTAHVESVVCLARSD